MAGAYIGDALREIRKSRGWTQEELAHRTGIPRVSINRFENNKEAVGRKRLTRLADVLDVSLADLGAREADAPAEYLPLHSRLEALEAEVEKMKRQHSLARRGAVERLDALEEAVDSLEHRVGRRRSDTK